MLLNNDKITNWQLGVFIFLAATEVVVIEFPSLIVGIVGNDAWFIPFITGLLLLIPLYAMKKVVSLYGEYGYVGALKKVFGNILGSVLAIPVAFCFNIIIVFEARALSESIKLYLLPNTPIEFTMLPMLFLTIYLVRCGIEPIVRFFELFLPVTIIGFIILVLTSSLKSDFSNIRPYFSQPPMNYLQGTVMTFSPFLGIEALLVLSPFLKKPEKAFKASAISVLCLAIINSAFIFLCIVRLGADETKSIMDPLMAVVKSTAIPGGVIERGEIVMVTMWAILAFTTCVSYAFMGAVVTADIFKHTESKHIVSFVIPSGYVLAMLPASILSFNKNFLNIITYLGGYTSVILPVLLCITMLIRESIRRRKVAC